MIRKCILALASAALGMSLAATLHAGSFLVDNLNDSGPGSLRDAIAAANSNPGADTIEFDMALSGIITLASDLPGLSDDVDILGPGAGELTVSGDFLHRPFAVSSGVTVTLSGLTVSNGQADLGGAIANEGNLNVSHCVLSGNSAEFGGGAIDNFGGSLVVSQSSLVGNAVGEGGFGGGIANSAGGTVTVIESTLSGNSAGFSGAAVDNAGMATILSSTLSSNNSDFGGAIENTGALIVRNSTLSGNSAITMGGGIDNFKAVATVAFSTLAENSSASGGGIGNAGTATIKNSLVVNSTSGGDCANDPGATFNSLGANFATDASCAGFTQTSPGALNLGALGDNGGETHTHALLDDSVAIDAAVDCTLTDGATPVTEDQRGVARPQAGDCDSGAFEAEEVLSDTIIIDGFESG